MNWFYVDAGQQAGPVDDAQLQDLVRTGRIQGDTLVWREGMPDWRPYAEARPETAPAPELRMAMSPSAQEPPLARVVEPAPGEEDSAACTECGRVFSKQDMIQYGTVHVCAACKPIFLQKLSEGVSVTTRRGRRTLPVNADDLIREITTRGYEVNIGNCISRGWGVVKANLGIAIGATLLVMLCNQAAGFIPFVGFIASLILQGPLLGGLNRFFLKLIRGEQATIGDAFSGFSVGFGRLCGTFLLMVLFIYLTIVPAFIILFATMQGGGNPSALFWVLLVPGVIAMSYLGVSFMFALPLSADLDLGPWDSLRVSLRVVSKHWFSIFALVFVAGLISALGIFALCIGLIVTLPIFYAATLWAYEDIFGAG